MKIKWTSPPARRPINQYSLGELYDNRSPNFLHHDERVAELREPQIMKAFASTLILRTPSSKFSQNGAFWHQYIMFEDFIQLAKDRDIPLRDAVEFAITDCDAHVFCDCLAPDTRILTKRGYVPVKDMVAGDEVLTHKGRWRPVLAIWSNSAPKQFYQLDYPGSLSPLTCSGEHKILTQLPGEVSWSTYWERVDALYDKSTGAGKYIHKVLLPVRETGVDFDPDYARLLGYYLSEGCVSRHIRCQKQAITTRSENVKLTFNVDECTTLAKDVQSICRKLKFKCDVRTLHCRDGRQWLNIHIKSNKFLQDCVRYCGLFSHTKQLSSEVFDWNLEARLQLISGWLLGDGHFSTSHGFVGCSVSEQLVMQMQVLAVLSGLSAHVSFRNKFPNSTTKYGLKKRPVYQVRFSKNYSLPLWERISPHLRYKDLDKGFSLTKGSTRSKIINGYWGRNLHSVVPVDYSGLHYDLSVEEDSSFIAEGILVHNCPAQLYWGYKYISTQLGYNYAGYRESRRPDENNPRLLGTTCKHLSNATLWLMDNIDEVLDWFSVYYQSVVAEDSDPGEDIVSVSSPDSSDVIAETHVEDSSDSPSDGAVSDGSLAPPSLDNDGSTLVTEVYSVDDEVAEPEMVEPETEPDAEPEMVEPETEPDAGSGVVDVQAVFDDLDDYLDSYADLPDEESEDD